MRAPTHLLIAVVLALLGANASSARTDDAGVTFRWHVSLGSVDAQPCEGAAMTLQLHDYRGTLVSTLKVSMELNSLGIGGETWEVNVPSIGNYLVTVVDHGCDEYSQSDTSIPIPVSGSEGPETIILLADGRDREWHLYYFGVTKRRFTRGVFEVGEDPLTLTNVSSNRIRVCRTMPGPQVQIFELLGGKWQEGDGYEYPEDLDAIQPGESVELKESRVRFITAKPDEGDEPDSRSSGVEARLLRLRTRPERGSYVYITEPPHGATDEAFIGFCDSHLVDLGAPPANEP